jgi:hypothetical protein
MNDTTKKMTLPPNPTSQQINTWVNDMYNAIYPGFPVPTQPLALNKPEPRTCVSIPINGTNGWLDVRIPGPDDPHKDSVFLTIDTATGPVTRICVNKDHLMRVLSELAIEKLAK